MKTVILTPFRPTAERQPIWDFVREWIAVNYNYPVFEADCDGVPFSSAQARNKAARLAGDWDVAVIHDADTIAHPEAIRYAVAEAQASMRMVFAGDSHMYCDPMSSQRIMQTGDASFPRPVVFNERGVYPRPSGGIFAVNRKLWERVGGYIESLVAWGYEDLCFLQCCGIFGDGHAYVPGHITVHLWHSPLTESADTRFNEQVWQTLTQYRVRRDQDGARHYLAGLGHSL